MKTGTRRSLHAAVACNKLHPHLLCPQVLFDEVTRQVSIHLHASSYDTRLARRRTDVGLVGSIALGKLTPRLASSEGNGLENVFV